MKFAKEKGASIVSLTDSRTSPIAFMIAESDDAAVAEIESFHRKREEHAVYWADDNK
jgi:DNA-binding MurR/RpiR family transcriptional regulator